MLVVDLAESRLGLGREGRAAAGQPGVLPAVLQDLQPHGRHHAVSFRRQPRFPADAMSGVEGRHERDIDGMSWNVLHVRPRCEKKMAEFCRIQRLAHYLPLRQETKIYQRRKVTVEKPVFPGYIFVSFDRDGRLELLKTNNIVRILETPDEHRLLRELDQIQKALAVDSTLGAVAALRKGRRVRITGGPFMGVEGLIQDAQGQRQGAPQRGHDRPRRGR